MTRGAAVVALLFLALGVGVAAPAGAADGSIEVNLKAVGHTDLGGGGGWDDVAVVGTTAVVSVTTAGCGASSATIVDLKAPTRPVVVGRLAVPDGLSVAGLAAQPLTTPAFTGDLLAVSLRPCRPGAAGGGVRYFDVSRPDAPRALGGTDVAGPGPHAVSMEVRPDGRVVAATAVDSDRRAGPDVELDDVTDPARPVRLSRWSRPVADPASCPVTTADAQLAEGGQRAVVAYDDGAVFQLDVADPARPAVLASADGRPGEGGDPYATSVPVGQRTLAAVSEGQGADPGCGGGSPRRGVRVLAVAGRAAMSDMVDVSYPSPAPPGRVVASGELAFVAWHGDGLRILDLGQVRPPTVAQFEPPSADVVGVAVMGDYLVVTDRTSGLYVLDRPSEGKAESLWHKIKYAIRFMSIPLVLGAVWAIPRLAMGTSPAASRSRVPVGAPVGRRRRR